MLHKPLFFNLYITMLATMMTWRDWEKQFVHGTFFEYADTECTKQNKHQMTPFLDGVYCENQHALTIFRVCLRNLVVDNIFLNILWKHSSLNRNPENKVYENWSSLEWKKGLIQQQSDKSGKAIKKYTISWQSLTEWKWIQVRRFNFFVRKQFSVSQNKWQILHLMKNNYY